MMRVLFCFLTIVALSFGVPDAEDLGIDALLGDETYDEAVDTYDLPPIPEEIPIPVDPEVEEKPKIEIPASLPIPTEEQKREILDSLPIPLSLPVKEFGIEEAVTSPPIEAYHNVPAQQYLLPEQIVPEEIQSLANRIPTEADLLLLGFDADTRCCEWARTGKCVEDPYIRVTCQKSCGTVGCEIESAAQCVVNVNTDHDCMGPNSRPTLSADPIALPRKSFGQQQYNYSKPGQYNINYANLWGNFDSQNADSKIRIGDADDSDASTDALYRNFTEVSQSAVNAWPAYNGYYPNNAEIGRIQQSAFEPKEFSDFQSISQLGREGFEQVAALSDSSNQLYPVGESPVDPEAAREALEALQKAHAVFNSVVTQAQQPYLPYIEGQRYVYGNQDQRVSSELIQAQAPAVIQDSPGIQYSAPYYSADYEKYNTGYKNSVYQAPAIQQKPEAPSPPPACEDTAQHCGYWADQGECENNPNFMFDDCKQSCKTRGLQVPGC